MCSVIGMWSPTWNTGWVDVTVTRSAESGQSCGGGGDVVVGGVVVDGSVTA